MSTSLPKDGTQTIVSRLLALAELEDEMKNDRERYTETDLAMTRNELNTILWLLETIAGTDVKNAFEESVLLKYNKKRERKAL